MAKRSSKSRKTTARLSMHNEEIFAIIAELKKAFPDSVFPAGEIRMEISFFRATLGSGKHHRYFSSDGSMDRFFAAFSGDFAGVAVGFSI
jgi:hypothetical protein